MEENKSNCLPLFEEISDKTVQGRVFDAVNAIYRYGMIANRKVEELRIKEDILKANELRMKECFEKREETIKLDVRGQLFTAPKRVFATKFGNYLHAIVSSEISVPSNNGTYFIDCYPGTFGRILSYLSSGLMSLDGMNKFETDTLLASMEYLLIDDITTPLQISYQDCKLPPTVSDELLALFHFVEATDNNIQRLESNEQRWRDCEAKLQDELQRQRSGDLITLNVGGREFRTYKSNLRKTERTGCSYFHALLCNDSWSSSHNGIIVG